MTDYATFENVFKLLKKEAGLISPTVEEKQNMIYMPCNELSQLIYYYINKNKSFLDLYYKDENALDKTKTFFLIFYDIYLDTIGGIRRISEKKGYEDIILKFIKSDLTNDFIDFRHLFDTHSYFYSKINKLLSRDNRNDILKDYYFPTVLMVMAKYIELKEPDKIDKSILENISEEEIVNGIRIMSIIFEYPNFIDIITSLNISDKLLEEILEEIFLTKTKIRKHQAYNIINFFSKKENINNNTKKIYGFLKNLILKYKNRFDKNVFLSIQSDVDFEIMRIRAFDDDVEYEQLMEKYDLIYNFLNIGQWGNEDKNNIFYTDYDINTELLELLLETQENFTKCIFESLVALYIKLLRKDKWTRKKSYFKSIWYVEKTLDTFFQNHFKIPLQFDTYIVLSRFIPRLKNLNANITKESILEFLNRVEPSEEGLLEWKETWPIKNDKYDIPPVPNMYITLSFETNASVHFQSTLNKSERILKKLIESNPVNEKDIEETSKDIEFITRLFATDKSKLEKNKEEYIKKHTIREEEILKCRISKDEPRYYGFGDIFEQESAKILPEDQRVELCDILIKIWKVIDSFKGDNDKWENLMINFINVFREHISSGVCNTGWIGGMISILDVAYISDYRSGIDEYSDLINKFVIDMKPLEKELNILYPTINKLFIKISNILLETKYDEDELKDMYKGDEEKLKKIQEKIDMYNDLFEPTKDLSLEYRKKVMLKFIECMKVPFFIEAYNYYYEDYFIKNNPKEMRNLIHIKEAVNHAFNIFEEYYLSKIKA